MKRYIFLEALFLCASLHAQELSLTVVNNAEFARARETVEINLQSLHKHLPVKSPLNFEVRELPVNKVLCSQVIDYDGNGVTDQLIFQADFNPGEEKQIRISVIPAAQACDTVTDARFVLPREDLAWENDMIAFRMYGPALAKDVRNGVDVWTKRVPYRIVAKWYKESEGSQPGKDTYHVDRGEGADFFSVGRTLGAGGSAVWKHDSLVQPPVFSRWKIVAAGPIRACFELWYDSVNVDGVIWKERRRISLDAGSCLNKMEVTYLGDTPSKEKLSFAAGLVKRKNVTAHADEQLRFASLWGPTNDDSVNGFLGTGIVVPKQFFTAVGEDKNHTLLKGKCLSMNSYFYYSGAGWSRNSTFVEQKEWDAYLKRFSERIDTPLKVVLTGSK